MPKTILRFIFALCIALLTALPAMASDSNKWRLQFSGNAESDGNIVIQLTSKGGETVQAGTDIEDGRSENGVAKDVVESLKAQLDKEHYHVERDDGEDVLIKRRRGTANFEVTILSNTVKGVRINPDKE
jgi:hypothetical protein